MKKIDEIVGYWGDESHNTFDKYLKEVKDSFVLTDGHLFSIVEILLIRIIDLENKIEELKNNENKA